MNTPGSFKSYRYVQTNPELEQLLPLVQQAGEIAVDTEADSLHHYFEKVCLIQLSVDQEDIIVDPLAGCDLSPLLNVLAEKPLILHGADYDLRMLRASFGFHPRRPVFDTMLAAQLLGYQGLGLAALVQRFMGVTLSKTGQRSNWSKRPLERVQLDYAVDDTHYLHSLARELRGQLQGLGRSDWHREACEKMVVASARITPRDPENEWRIKGLKDLEGPSLNMVRSLWYWRDQQARECDRPSFKIMGNEQLLALANWAAAHPTEPLTKGPKLPRHFTGQRLEMLKTTVQQAHKTSEDQYPRQLRRQKKATANKNLVKTLRAEVAVLADELKIAPSTLASKTPLTNIAQAKPSTVEEIMANGPLMRWQARLLQPVLERTLNASNRQ